MDELFSFFMDREETTEAYYEETATEVSDEETTEVYYQETKYVSEQETTFAVDPPLAFTEEQYYPEPASNPFQPLVDPPLAFTEEQYYPEPASNPFQPLVDPPLAFTEEQYYPEPASNPLAFMEEQYYPEPASNPLQPSDVYRRSVSDPCLNFVSPQVFKSSYSIDLQIDQQQQSASTTSSIPLKVQPTEEQPKLQMLAVIGSKFCSPNHVSLNAVMNGNIMFLEDSNGKIMFKIKQKTQFLRQRRVLSNAKGKPLVTLQEKMITAHNRWNAFKGDSINPKDLLFCVKESSLDQFKIKLDVYLDYKEIGYSKINVKYIWVERSCVIYARDSTAPNTQMHKKLILGSMMTENGKVTITIYPNIDSAFIVALLVILCPILDNHPELAQ